jgi:opacity protein-like surface antigen
MKKYMLLSLLLIAGTFSAKAQGNLTSIQYTVGFPTGDLKDFIGKTSWRGVNFDYRRSFTDNWSAGLSIGYQLFYEEKENATIERGTQTLFGNQFRYVNSCPMTANLAYSFKPGEMVNPYVGLGVGTFFRETVMDIGLYRWSDESWHFAVRPEIGILYEPEPGVGLMVNVKYMNGFETKDMGSASFISLNVGVAWTWY